MNTFATVASFVLLFVCVTAEQTYTIDKPENGDKCILSNKEETPEELKKQEQKCYKEEKVNPAILDASIAKICGSKVYMYKEIDCNENRVRRDCPYQWRYVSRILVFRYCSYRRSGICVSSIFWIEKRYRITIVYRVRSC